MTTPNFQCARCARFFSDNFTLNACEAYPEGIPEKIIDNEHDHREPYKGDNGLRFKKKEDGE